ncbi:MAG TPA: GNAT family protein [Clostridia bacterium]|nr:GNAT family protein [Clostridia bacterium]
MSQENDGAMDLPVITKGTRVVLTPQRRENVPTYWKWICDPEVNAGLTDAGACVSVENEYEWYDNNVAKATESSVNFDIHEVDGMRLVGDCALFDIDHAAGTAEVGLIIGEKDCWNHGYAAEAASLLARYAFDVRGLISVILHVYDFNERAIAAYRKAGFREIGRRRNVRHGSRIVQEIIMDIVPGEVAAI